MRLLLFKGDIRMGVMRDHLIHYGWNVDYVETIDELKTYWDIKYDAIVLPVGGIDDRGCISMNKEFHNILDFICQIHPDTILISGIETNFLQNLKNPKMILLDDERVVEENAKLTAEGILYLILDHKKVALNEETVDVIGFGHCGKHIVDILTKCNVNVRVVSTRLLPSFFINQKFVKTILLEDYYFTQPNNWIVNTAPTLMITHEYYERCNLKPNIIDLASGHIGVESSIYDLGMSQLIKAGPLPSMIAYQSAGKILANAIIERMTT